MLRPSILVTMSMMLLCAAATVWSQLTAEKEPQPSEASKEVKAQRDQYQAILEQRPEQLAELGRERGIMLLAQLAHGRAIATAETREKNLEHTRVELMAAHDEAMKTLSKLRAQVDSEMERIRQQFADNPAEVDRQLMAMVAKYRPRAVQLKAEITRSKQLADETDGKLAAVRQNLAHLNSEKDLLAQGHKFTRPPATTGPRTPGMDAKALELARELGLDPSELQLSNVPPDKGSAKPSATPAVSSESVKKSVDELKKLF